MEELNNTEIYSMKLLYGDEQEYKQWYEVIPECVSTTSGCNQKIRPETPFQIHETHDEYLDPDKYMNELSKSIEEYIEKVANKEKWKLSPYRLHAQISGYYYENARVSIIRFFKEESIFVNYGYSSSHMRSHNLYRGKNGIIYVIHMWMGEINDAFYFSRSELETYFENDMDNIPDYDDPPELSEYS